MIVALHSKLKPGHEQAYDRDHARIPADLRAAFDRAGIREWRIWRSGLDVFHLVDCDDFEAAIATVDADPSNAGWQEVIDPHVDHFVDQGTGAPGLHPLRLVHSLLDPAVLPGDARAGAEGDHR